MQFFFVHDVGLVDLSSDPDFERIYDENMNEDPTYDPNSAQEKRLFMQYADNILLKLTFGTTQVQQHENVFKFDAIYRLTNLIRMTEDHLDTVTYQRLQQRLALQQKLVKKHLQNKTEIRKNIQYLKIMSFLIPVLIGFKRRMKIPNLNKLLQPYSGKRIIKEFFKALFINFISLKYISIAYKTILLSVTYSETLIKCEFILKRTSVCVEN